jgi:hypothetical protein
MSPRGDIPWILLDLPLRINYKRCGPCSLRSNITKPISMRPVAFVIVFGFDFCRFPFVCMMNLMEIVVFHSMTFFFQVLDKTSESMV